MPTEKTYWIILCCILKSKCIRLYCGSLLPSILSKQIGFLCCYLRWLSKHIILGRLNLTKKTRFRIGSTIYYRVARCHIHLSIGSLNRCILLRLVKQSRCCVLIAIALTEKTNLRRVRRRLTIQLVGDCFIINSGVGFRAVGLRREN